MKKSIWMSYVLLAIGIGFIAWLVYKLGPREILRHFQEIGFNFFLFLIPTALSNIFFTQAWNTYLKSNQLKVPFWHLFMAKQAGEAINISSPLSWGGGDPVRIYLIKKWVPVSQATASVVIDRTLNAMTSVLFMMIGILIALIHFELTPALKWGFIGALLFSFVVTFYFYRRQHEGMFEFLIDLLKKLRLKKNWEASTIEKAKEVDQLISQFYRESRKAFAWAFILQFLTRIMGVAEIYFGAYFLGVELDWMGAYLVASITVVINIIFVFIPGSVGVLEGTYAGVFHLLHADAAAGTSIQIFRRIRMILWAAPGFYYIYHLDRQTRLELHQKAQESDTPEIEYRMEDAL
ncbi:MAG: flippase-like domain-containing protein [Deltaproteobacteria bacterium]|nr:flippase-like domain-containing protein [Deltaproteobacteria bacterium]